MDLIKKITIKCDIVFTYFKFIGKNCIYSILILGGAFEGVEDQVSPFGYKRGEGIDAGAGEPEWIVKGKV